MNKNVHMTQEYIRTELGLIPSDWHIKEFQDVMTGFFSGATPYRGRTEYYKGNIKWITSGELNYNVITDTLEKISEEAVKNTNLKILPKGTFLFAITGLEAEGTRGSCGITGVNATTNQSCMALFPKETLDNNYLYHFYVWQGKMLAFRYCQGTKQQSYTGKIARTLPIILPPTLSEQTAIATALSDIDALINNISKLIVKKQNIKQGAMQELLSGKKRLAGYTDIWDIRRLGDLAEMSSGGTPLTSNSTFYNGEIPWVIIADMTKAGKYIDKTEKTITEAGLLSSSARLFKKGVLLFAMYASIGKCTIAKMDTACNQAILGISTKTVDTEFLYYFLHFNESRFIRMGQTGTQSNLNKEIVQELKVPYPTIKEQVDIASILSDIDIDIDKLEKKLNKFKMIKQGMMHALLTGKIRLS